MFIKWIVPTVFVAFTTIIGGITFAERYKEVLVKIGDYQITKDDYNQVVQDLGLTDSEQIRNTIISQMIEGYVIGNHARSKELDKLPSVQRKISFMENMVLRDAYLTKFIEENIDEFSIKEEYNKRKKEYVPQTEYNASHILVDSEDEIKKVKSEIDSGGKFADMAKKYSKDSTSQKGGDLGFFVKDMMVKPFGEAVANLEIGKISEPIKTNFGWHLIRLTEKRQKPFPSFKEIEQRLRSELTHRIVSENIEKLKKEAGVEILKQEKS